MNKTTAKTKFENASDSSRASKSSRIFEKKTRTQKEVYRRTDAAFAIGSRAFYERERERREERKKAKENASRGSGDLSRSSTLFPVV